MLDVITTILRKIHTGSGTKSGENEQDSWGTLYSKFPINRGKTRNFTAHFSLLIPKITFISTISYKSQTELHSVRTFPRVKWTRIRNPTQNQIGQPIFSLSWKRTKQNYHCGAYSLECQNNSTHLLPKTKREGHLPVKRGTSEIYTQCSWFPLGYNRQPASKRPQVVFLPAAGLRRPGEKLGH